MQHMKRTRCALLDSLFAGMKTHAQRNRGRGGGRRRAGGCLVALLLGWGAGRGETAEVFQLRAVALTNRVVLRWTDPQAAGYASRAVLIRSSTNGYPGTTGDGMEVYRGTSTAFRFVHTGLVARKAYYYTAWTSHDGEHFVWPDSEYLVVDLSGGADATNYPVRTLSAPPGGGWTEADKTTRLVLRRVPAGVFSMGSPTGELGRAVFLMDETRHAVTLTNGFYIGVFPVTQRQWERVMGTWPSHFSNALHREARPVERVSYHAIRGAGTGTNWPASRGVDASSFLGRLRARTGVEFDLPTEAQWEYACRAGAATALNSGRNLSGTESCSNLTVLGRYKYNGGAGSVAGDGPAKGTAIVGSHQPNAWGLYDFHGNVWEWCLDWHGDYAGAVTEPKGPATGWWRIVRGGSWGDRAADCRAATRSADVPESGNEFRGFRMAWVGDY